MPLYHLEAQIQVFGMYFKPNFDKKLYTIKLNENLNFSPQGNAYLGILIIIHCY